MRYQGLLVAIFVIVVVCVVVGGALVVSSRISRQRHRQTLAWERAKLDAQWQDQVDYRDGVTTVSVVRVAKLGDRREVISEMELETLFDGEENYAAKLDAVWATARERAFQLNTGPL
jgi:hypothetical protein